MPRNLATLRQNIGLVQQSSALSYTSGWKHRLTADVFHRLNVHMSFTREFETPYFGVFRIGSQWWLWAKTGCCYDGPTWCPDFKFLMVAALIHDILHWLIMHGILPETANPLIDMEFKLAVLNGEEPIPWYLGGESSRALHAHIVHRAVGLVDQKAGERKTIYEVKF